MENLPQTVLVSDDAGAEIDKGGKSSKEDIQGGGGRGDNAAALPLPSFYFSTSWHA